jgi:hypothetical protein
LKQYSDRKLSGFFSGGFLPTSRTFQQELAGNYEKNPKNLRPEYCFHKITGITRNREFPGRVVRPEMVLKIYYFSVQVYYFLI